MNKKGFTLIELLVSIALLSVVLIFMLGSLVKLKDVYAASDNDSDIRVYSYIIARSINKDVLNNGGIGVVTSCNKMLDSDDYKCNFTLKNGEQRELLLRIDISSPPENETNGKTFIETTNYISTIEYKIPTTNKLLLIQTLKASSIHTVVKNSDIGNYKIKDDVKGYYLNAISYNDYEYQNKTNSSKKDIINIITIGASNKEFDIKIVSATTQ